MEHIHPADRQRVDQSIHAVIDGSGHNWSGEYRFLRADGSYAEILDRGTVLRDEKGGALRMIGAMLDQTERKRQQDALRENEMMLRKLTEAMPAMAWVSAPDGAVEWFNARWYEYIGSKPGSDLGNDWAGYLHPEDRDSATGRWAEALRTGSAFQNEHRFVGADDRYRWFLVRGMPMHDAKEDVARWFGTCTDIQELVEARDVLSRSREELAREVEARTRELDRIWSISEDLLVVCDRDMGCRNANAAWAGLLGWGAVELIGRCLDTLVDPQDLPRWTEAKDTLQRSGTVKDLDVRLRAREGPPRWTTWNLRAEGDMVYGSGRDITRRLELGQKLRQAHKMETVGKLTGGWRTTSTTCSRSSPVTCTCSSGRWQATPAPRTACRTPWRASAGGPRCRVNCSPLAAASRWSPRY